MYEALEQIRHFEDLPVKIQSQIQTNNPEQQWYNLLLSHHSSNRSRWKGHEFMNFYRDLIRYLRLKLEIFPYHLCRYLNFTSPFDYYTEMICDLLRTQKPYDTLPTFTAAEILRIIGIHRNSYSDLLCKCKEKGWVSKISRAIRRMLPKSPLSIPVEAWWMVFPLLHKTTRKTASKSEIDCLHEICKDFANKTSTYAGQYDREALEGLYRAMVVEFDVEMRGVQFEVVRDTRSFVMDKSGFGKEIGEVLKCCSVRKEVNDICQVTGLNEEIVYDCLGILSRLGFLDVMVKENSEWHRSWFPLSDHENSSVSPSQSIEAMNSEDSVKVTLAIGKESGNKAVKGVKEILGKWQVDTIESNVSAVVLNSAGLDPVVFANLNNTEAPLYRLFKLKFCKSTPVLYLQKGFILTVLPKELRGFGFYLLHSDASIKELHKNDLMMELQELLPISSVFIIPLKHRFLNILTIPLPFNVISVKDRSLISYLRELDLLTHFEHFVGYIEIAALTDKKFTFLNQYHGIPLHNHDMALIVAKNLMETPWFKYNTLEVVIEAQQNEVFQYREFICNIDMDQGLILLN